MLEPNCDSTTHSDHFCIEHIALIYEATLQSCKDFPYSQIAFLSQSLPGSSCPSPDHYKYRKFRLQADLLKHKITELPNTELDNLSKLATLSEITLHIPTSLLMKKSRVWKHLDLCGSSRELRWEINFWQRLSDISEDLQADISLWNASNHLYIICLSLI